MTATKMWPCLSLTMSFSLVFCQSEPLRAQSESRAAAREHFDRGVAAYDEKRFSDAAEEFESAYKLSRAFKILFNVGQVNVALGRPVEAVDAYDRYLKQGGATITAERRKEVQIEIEHQLARIGTLAIRTSPEGADVRIDGALVGKSPLPRAIRVGMGRHTVEAILAEHVPQVEEVEVPGRTEVEVDLLLGPFASPSAPAPPAPTPAKEPPAIVPVEIRSPPAVEPGPPAGQPAGGAGPRPTVPVAGGSAAEPAGTSINWPRIVGGIVLAGGLATATVGGLTAYKASNQSSDARARLAMATDAMDTAAYDLAKPAYDAAVRRNQIGWTIAGVGAAIFIGGIVLLATVPEKHASVVLAPWTTATANGLAFEGAW